MYGINLPLPQEGEDPDRPPTAHEILNVYGSEYYIYLWVVEVSFTAKPVLSDVPRDEKSWSHYTGGLYV